MGEGVSLGLGGNLGALWFCSVSCRNISGRRNKNGEVKSTVFRVFRQIYIK